MSARELVNVNDLVLVQGWSDTRRTLAEWNRSPWKVLRPWLLLSLAISLALLGATWWVASISAPDPTPPPFPGLFATSDLGAVGHVLLRNGLVLALHGFACVAGFIAGSSLPLSASKRTGISRWVHEKAGPLAIAFVIAATAFSLFTQAYALGGGARNLATALDMSPALLIVGLIPHALPELVALFLPLAAWTIAARKDDWHTLLAATFVTCGLAAPVLVLTSFMEVYVSPHVILALR